MIFLLSLYVLQLVSEFYSANRNMKQTNWSLQYCVTVYFYNIIFLKQYPDFSKLYWFHSIWNMVFFMHICMFIF